MAGFLDVSALLQRKSLPRDLNSNSSPGEAGRKEEGRGNTTTQISAGHDAAYFGKSTALKSTSRVADKSQSLTSFQTTETADTAIAADRPPEAKLVVNAEEKNNDNAPSESPNAALQFLTQEIVPPRHSLETGSIVSKEQTVEDELQPVLAAAIQPISELPPGAEGLIPASQEQNSGNLGDYQEPQLKEGSLPPSEEPTLLERLKGVFTKSEGRKENANGVVPLSPSKSRNEERADVGMAQTHLAPGHDESIKVEQMFGPEVDAQETGPQEGTSSAAAKDDSASQSGLVAVAGANDQTTAVQPGTVDNSDSALGHQGSGRLHKIGGLFKRTLSFTRSKNDVGEEVVIKESDGLQVADDKPSKERADREGASGELNGENSNPQPDTPTPRIGRANSNRVRNLLKKITPGGNNITGEGGGAHSGTSADHSLPQNGDLEAAEHSSQSTGPQKESIGVSAEQSDAPAASVDPGRDAGAPAISPQGSGKVGGLLRMLSLKRNEADGGQEISHRASEEVISAFRIPKYLLPGRGQEKVGGIELEGTESPPASPLIVFVDSQANGQEGNELQRELTSMLGGSQVFDVAHLPPKGFLDALLPIISEQAQKGDQVAAAVKDSLRILVIGEDTLFKSVTSALHGSNMVNNIPVGCVPNSSSSTLAQALGLSHGRRDVSRESALELLSEVASAGTQSMDYWSVKLSTHRKRMASALPSSFENVTAHGGKTDWVLSHRSLCWNSLHLDMGYVNTYKEGGENGVSQRRKSSWLCGMCATEAPRVIGSQNVGRLEISKDGSWCYLELSPRIQSLEFVNLAEDSHRTRRKMKMLDKGLSDAYADDGLIEILGVQEGSDVEICLAQTNAVRLELFGNSDIDHVKLWMDAESWDQPLAGETTAHPAVIEIAHAGEAFVLVTNHSTLKCTADPVFPAPIVTEPPPLETTQEKPPTLLQRSASPFRKGGAFRSASPFRKGGSFRRSRSPAPRRPSEEASETTGQASESNQEPSEPNPDASEHPPTAEPAPNRVLLRPRSPNGGRTFGPGGRRRAQSPVPGGRTSGDQEVRPASNGPKRPTSAPKKAAQSSSSGYADAAAAAAKGQGGLIARRQGATIPWTLKVDKLVETERVQPQQKLGRTQSGSGSGRQEIVEPAAKVLVRTGSSGRVAVDEYGRPPSPSLYRSSSRDNLDQIVLSRPASPAFYRSSSRDNLDLMGQRPPSPSLSRQNSGNTGYSPRVSMMHPPRSESPVHYFHSQGSREPTPERMPRMADWAAGTSRRSFTQPYMGSSGVHSHLLTKLEREQAVAIGLGSTLTREERERMQSLAFGGSSGLDRGSTPNRIRSARARYAGPGVAMYNAGGPLELDLATSAEVEKAGSPPPPVRTAKDYFSGPLTAGGLPAVRKSHA